MGPVRDDERDRPSYTRTKSAARLFNELLERVSPEASSDKVKSPPFASKDTVLLPDITSSPPPMDAPNFTYTTSKSKEDTSSNPLHIFESLQSQYNQHQPHDPLPTDSHSRNHPRNRARRRSSRSSETISAMLLLATERLAQETSRANEAERQSSEILSRLKIAHHAKQRLEVDLQKANNELGLYKIQLDNAQAEIRRAQETVDKVDRQRADAEDELCRGRDKIRKLTEVRSIELAMEEGRRLGYDEGMRQGRLMQARDSELNQPTRHSRRNSARTVRDDDDDDDDQVTYFSYGQEEWQSTESFRSFSEPSTSGRSLSRRRQTSDARHAAHPISSILTSPPPTNHNQSSLSTQPKDNADEPENISVRPHSTKDTPTISIRPISIKNRSPTVSHRSFKLPPDGYIPTIGADSVISLPPPHELSMPFPSTTAPQPSASVSDSKGERKKTPTSRSFEHADPESRKHNPKSVDGDSTSHFRLSRQPHASDRHKEPAHTRPTSAVSGTSTNVFQSSLLGPPDSNNIGKKENNEEADYFTAGAKRIWSPSQTSTQFEKIPSKRRVTPDSIPPSPSPAQSYLDKDNETTSKMQGKFIIERPSSTDRTKRRPREIVLATPLMRSLLNLNNVQKPNGTSQKAVNQWRDDTDRHSPGYHNPRPQYVRGSASNISVPGIEIVTPSSPTLSTRSAKTVIDPILLSPESARSTPLVQPTNVEPPTTSLGMYSNPPVSMSMLGDEQQITMILPDNNLPPGFIPLSPIQGMKNLDSYPSGFAPSMSKLQDEYPGGQLPSNFSYPSSPLIKSGV